MSQFTDDLFGDAPVTVLDVAAVGTEVSDNIVAAFMMVTFEIFLSLSRFVTVF